MFLSITPVVDQNATTDDAILSPSTNADLLRGGDFFLCELLIVLAKRFMSPGFTDIVVEEDFVFMNKTNVSKAIPLNSKSVVDTPNRMVDPPVSLTECSSRTDHRGRMDQAA